MPRKRVVMILAACTFLMVAVWTAGVFYWSIACCVSQHQEALGRQVAIQMLEGSTNGLVTVPAAASYKVRDTWPMQYELHLRAGYQFPDDVTKRTNSEAVIAYFVAHPAYPFWARGLGVVPRSKELLVLHASFGVHFRPRERLVELTEDW